MPQHTAQRSFAALRQRAARRFRLVEQPITLPASDTTYRVLQPATFDRLLTAAARDPEQNLPYWATLWPSGIALADALLQTTLPAGTSVLELGCGLGVTATAALATGARLLVTDYSTDALLLARANALRNIGCAPRTLHLNWRQPSPVLLAQAPFPVVLAADVLYEARDVMPLLALAEQLVAPGGTLWLAEPGRPPAQRFVAAALMTGWHEERLQHAGPWPDPQDRGVEVTIHVFRRQG